MAVKVLRIFECEICGFEKWDSFTTANARKAFNKEFEVGEIDFIEKKANAIVIGHDEGMAVYVKQ